MKYKTNPNRYITPAFVGVRDKAWATQRLELINKRLGTNIGAKRERERLANIINGVVKPPKAAKIHRPGIDAPVSKAEERRVDMKAPEVLTPEEELRRELRRNDFDAKKKGKRRQ